MLPSLAPWPRALLLASTIVGICATHVGCSEQPAARYADAATADAGSDASAPRPADEGLSARDRGAADAARGADAASDPAGQLFGVNINPASPGGNPSAAELRAAGVRWVRVEWGGGHGYAVYDPAIAALRAGGIAVLLLVDYASTGGAPASSAGAAEWATYRTTFSARVAELAEHYGDEVDAWQIWNEPDLFAPHAGYDPGVPAAEYAALLAEAVAAIRPRSSRPIVGGSLASGDPGYWRDVEAAAGAPIAVDALAIHPYGKRAPDDWPHASWGFGNMSAALDEYLALAGARALWITEIGTDQVATPDFPADYLEHVYELVADRYAGRVPHVFWFCWSDAMVEPYGLLDASGAPKPSYERYRARAGPW